MSKQQNAYPEGVSIVAGDFNQTNLRSVLPRTHQDVTCPTRGKITLDVNTKCVIAHHRWPFLVQPHLHCYPEGTTVAVLSEEIEERRTSTEASGKLPLECVESILTNSITAWYRSCNRTNLKVLQRVINVAQNVNETKLPWAEDIYKVCSHSRTSNTIRTQHNLHTTSSKYLQHLQHLKTQWDWRTASLQKLSSCSINTDTHTHTLSLFMCVGMKLFLSFTVFLIIIIIIFLDIYGAVLPL